MNQADVIRRPADQSARARYHCEREIDRVLNRRQALRSGPPYSPVSIDTLVDGARSLLSEHIAEPFEIRDPRWLAGGTSKLQIAFECAGEGKSERMVLRMEPAESLVETSRLREFEITQKLQGILPVPKALFVDPEGKHFPYPAAVYGFSTGVSKPREAEERVSGMGLNFGRRLRPLIADEFIRHLATLHSIDPASLRLESFDLPSSAAEAAEWQISWWERVWDEDYNLDVPLVRIATSWMRDNLPQTDIFSVVHGDYRNGNFLFDEESGRITALLDWELSHVGDRHEDLAYLLQRSYGHFSEDGKTYLVCGMTSHDDFIRRYEKASGLSVVPATLKFYEVLNLYKCAAITRATGPKVVRGGKSHQDAVICWANSISYLLMEELRRVLEEVI